MISKKIDLLSDFYNNEAEVWSSFLSYFLFSDLENKIWSKSKRLVEILKVKFG